MAEAAARLREPGAEAPASIFTREELERQITEQKKVFLKTPCAECGGSCGLVKRFKDTMPMIVKSMADSFWCKECGRVLCNQHRENHTCERLDAEKEKRKLMSPEEIRRRMEEEMARDEAAKAAARDEQRAAAVLLERQKLERKERRKLIATKAKHIENFIQQCAREGSGSGGDVRVQRAHAELLELYTKARGASLALYNEFEHPSSQEVGGENWEAAKAVYARARELTGMVITLEGMPLDVRNPWDPPPAESSDPP